jgi:hypothetical protein
LIMGNGNKLYYRTFHLGRDHEGGGPVFVQHYRMGYKRQKQ